MEPGPVAYVGQRGREPQVGFVASGVRFLIRPTPPSALSQPRLCFAPPGPPYVTTSHSNDDSSFQLHGKYKNPWSIFAWRGFVGAWRMPFCLLGVAPLWTAPTCFIPFSDFPLSFRIQRGYRDLLNGLASSSLAVHNSFRSM